MKVTNLNEYDSCGANPLISVVGGRGFDSPTSTV